MNAIGDFGNMHFLDLNKDESAYGLPYTTRVKSIEKSDRALAYLEGECKKFYIKLTPP